MSTPEINTVIGRRTGKLIFNMPDTSQYELHLLPTEIWSMRLNGVHVESVDEAKRHLNTLSHSRQGAFEFLIAPAAELEHRFEISRNELIQSGLGDAAEDAADVHTIPDKLTRFRLRPGATSILNRNLQEFLTKAQRYLSQEQGASAAELAQALYVSEMRVQIYFQRLRAMGQITPVRAYVGQSEGYNKEQEVVGARATGAGGYSSNGVSTPTPSQPAPSSQPTPASRPAYAPQPSHQQAPASQAAQPAQNRGLIRRLLSAISFGGRK